MSDASHSFESYYKRATSPLVVLRLLNDETMYGYQISQAMLRKSNGRFSIAVLYPILYRLEEQGYIRGYYTITQEGRQYLAKSLEEYMDMHNTFMSIVESGDQ